MHYTETHTLHGIASRLLYAITAHRSDASVLARWTGKRPDIFGALPPVTPVGRHRPGVSPQDWQALGEHIGAALWEMAAPPDQSLARLGTVTVHLGLGADETDVWAALAQKAPLSALGLVQSDATRPVMGDEPYAPSGLLLALLYPSGQRSSRLML